MKTILTLIFIVILTFTSISQGTWSQQTNFSGTPRFGAVSFSINNKAYLGLGYDGNYKRDFWEWDQATNVWTQKADFGGIGRAYPIGFSIGTKGYTGTGNQAGTHLNDFWEWNQASNTWTQKSNCGGTVRTRAVGFSIGNKGYIGTGTDNITSLTDFWEWNQATDTWTQKANFGGSPRNAATGFAIGTKGYIGTGGGAGNFIDFWEWDQSSNTWIQKANFPGAARFGAIGFSFGLKGYIGTGTNFTSYYKDFWEWDQTTNIWTQKADFGGNSRLYATAFSIGTKGYVGTGFDGTNRYNDMWEFNPGICSGVSITSQPINQGTSVGQTATFSINAIGTTPISYQWYKNNVIISGANSSSYTTPNLVLGDNGNLYKCITNNCSGVAVTSSSASVTVNGTTTPIINSITFTNKIENHNNIEPLYTLYNGSAFSSNTPINICADGSGATFIKVNVSNTSGIGFKIIDPTNPTLINDDKNGKINTPYTFGNNVEVQYTHPKFLDITPYRNLILKVTFNTNEIDGISFPIRIYNAPALFVHGLWGNVNTFSELESHLINNNLYPQYDNILFLKYNTSSKLTLRADYEASNAKHLATNSNVVPSEINSLLRRVRQVNFSAGKVDIICHSMGGILARQYLNGTYQGYNNDINKLITLNTPHKGSPVANYLQWTINLHVRLALLIKNYRCNEGAIDDLFVNSTDIINLNNPTNQTNKVPSRTIATVGYSSDETEALAVRVILDNALTCHNVFNSEQNDLIVPLTSQECGIFSNLNPAATNQWHVGSSRNRDVKDTLVRLIKSSPNSQLFTNNGFGTDNLLSSPTWQYCNPLIPSPSANTNNLSPNPEVYINSPASQQSFYSGDSVNLFVSSQGDISKLVVFIGNENINAYILDSNCNSLNTKFKIPLDAFGKMNIVAIGGDNYEFKTFDTLSFEVQSSALLDSIKLIPDSVSLANFQEISFKVLGYFNDGYTRDITGNSNLIYDTDTSSVEILNNNLIKAKDNSIDTSLTISISNKFSTSKIHVYIDSTILKSVFTSNVNIICKNETVKFVDCSFGDPINSEWHFEGGIPMTSNSKTPTIQYNSSGTFDVQLINTWPTGKIDTITIPNFITSTYCPLVLNLKVFLQGFYLGNGTLYSSIDGHPMLCDTITVELRNANEPYEIKYSLKGTIDKNGIGNFAFLNLLESQYYIVIKHRNSLETWSALPIQFGNDTIDYDFTTSATKAYGNNLVDLNDGYFGIWSGDIADSINGVGFQDGKIDYWDLKAIEDEIYSISAGYRIADLTGDGIIESIDYSLIEGNLQYLLVVKRP